MLISISAPFYPARWMSILDNRALNAKWLQDLLHSGKQVFVSTYTEDGETTHTPIFKSGITYFSHDGKQITSCNNVRTTTISRIGKVIVHELVWRSERHQPLQLPTDFFRKFMLNINGKILCDVKYTEFGRVFWLKQTDWAFKKKLHVYLVHYAIKEKTKDLKIYEIPSMSFLWNEHNNAIIWSREGWNWRILLSKTRIETDTQLDDQFIWTQTDD